MNAPERAILGLLSLSERTVLAAFCPIAGGELAHVVWAPRLLMAHRSLGFLGFIGFKVAYSRRAKGGPVLVAVKVWLEEAGPPIARACAEASGGRLAAPAWGQAQVLRWLQPLPRYEDVVGEAGEADA